MLGLGLGPPHGALLLLNGGIVVEICALSTVCTTLLVVYIVAYVLLADQRGSASHVGHLVVRDHVKFCSE